MSARMTLFSGLAFACALAASLAGFSFSVEAKDEPPSQAVAKLQALDPFLGEWVGTTATEVGQKPLQVKASYKKILNGTCIEYETEVRAGDEPDQMMTQKALIGWDKTTGMLRAWGFRSNGQRWEASWDPDKEKNPAPGTKVWVSEYVWFMPDGDDQTGTSIKTVKGKDSYSESITHRMGDGNEPLNLPVIEYKRQK